MRFVVLLRGINVGKNRTIPMGDLKQALEQAGFSNVETYIRSGNVAIDHPGGAPEVADACRSAIEKEFGFEVPVAVLTAPEIGAVVAANPYGGLADADPTKVHVAFLGASLDTLPPVEGQEGEEATVGPRCVFLRLPNGLGRSKFAELVSRQLPPEATMRNWRTVLKLVEMAT